MNNTDTNTPEYCKVNRIVKFSPDSHKIVTAELRNSTAHLRLWDLEGSNIESAQFEEIGSIAGLGFSPKGKPRIAMTVSGENILKVMDLSFKQIGLLKHNTYGWTNDLVEFSPRGGEMALILSLNEKNVVRFSRLQLNDTETGSKKSGDGRPGEYENKLFCPDGNENISNAYFNSLGKLVIFGSDGSICDDKGVVLTKLPHQRSLPDDTHFLPEVPEVPEGQRFIMLYNSTFSYLDLKERQRQLNKHELSQKGIQSISFSPDGRKIAAIDVKGTVHMLDIDIDREGKLLEGKRLTILNDVNSVSFSPDGNTIAATGDGNMVRLLNLQTMEVKKFQAHGQKVLSSVRWSKDNEKIGTIGHKNINDEYPMNSVLLWNKEGKSLGKSEQYTDTHSIQDISFPSKGSLPILITKNSVDPLKRNNIEKLITKNPDNLSKPNKNNIERANMNFIKVSFWGGSETDTLLSGKQIKNTIDFVGISQDGRLLFIASGTTIYLWDMDYKRLVEFSTDKTILSLSLSHDKSMLAVIGKGEDGKDGTTELWQLGGVDYLLSKSCDQLKESFSSKFTPESASDKHLCDDI